jgi:cytochrome c biogenesis protein CcmG, thiol:disulfide interchange protein DsbE
MTKEMDKVPTEPTRRASIPVWAQLLIWGVLLVLLVIFGISLSRASQPIIKVGSQVPDFNLTLMSGYEYNSAGSVNLSELRGKVVLVNVWASWCPPCKDEAADLEAAWNLYQPGGQVVFLGVDYVDTEPEARAYLEEFAITYPNGPDLQTKISQIFNRNMGVPETYLIDQQGILRASKIGPFQSVAEIQAFIDPLLTGN